MLHTHIYIYISAVGLQASDIVGDSELGEHRKPDACAASTNADHAVCHYDVSAVGTLVEEPDSQAPDHVSEHDVVPSSCTGLVEMSPADMSQHVNPLTPEPEEGMPKKKKAKTTRGPLIACPPVLAPAVVTNAEKGLDVEGQKGDVEAQRQLKKQLIAEAKAKAEQKKLETENKQKAATDLAIAKAQAKLEKAIAKAEALDKEKKGKGGKGDKGVARKLDPAFAAAQSSQLQPPEAASPPPKPPRSKHRSAPVKLSPKAKEFACKSGTASASRMNIALDSMKVLRELKLADLVLPDQSFSKKTLGCIQVVNLRNIKKVGVHISCVHVPAG